MGKKCYNNKCKEDHEAPNDKNKNSSKEGEKTMYETVKTVKGYEIKRMIGTTGAYHVNVKEGKGFREFHTFRTIKAAVKFIEDTL